MWIASSLRLVGLRAHVRSWIRDEAVAIRHLHFGQSLRIHDVVVANDGVEVQDIGRDRIDLGWFQETRFVERHRAIDVVPQRRGIWPEAADGLEGPRCSKSSLPANEDRAHVALRLGPLTPRPWAANPPRSAATGTRPSGRPVPSGAIAEPRSRISSRVGGRPTPNAGDCAASGAVAASIVSVA